LPRAAARRPAVQHRPLPTCHSGVAGRDKGAAAEKYLRGRRYLAPWHHRGACHPPGRRSP
jgi:hypothetical protein